MILLLDSSQITNIVSCQQSCEPGLADAGPLTSASMGHQSAGLPRSCDEQHCLHSQVCTCHVYVHKQFIIDNIAVVQVVSAHACAAGVTCASLYCLL